jgi:uncharacterized peroxidase-related enzyme
LLQLTNNAALVEQLKTDWRTADLISADQAILAYAEKLTLEPSNMLEADVIALRQVGLSDAAILDTNQVAAYYAYANRLIDGLGVEVEDILNSGR